MCACSTSARVQVYTVPRNKEKLPVNYEGLHQLKPTTATLSTVRLPLNTISLFSSQSSFYLLTKTGCFQTTLCQFLFPFPCLSTKKVLKKKKPNQKTPQKTETAKAQVCHNYWDTFVRAAPLLTTAGNSWHQCKRKKKCKHEHLQSLSYRSTLKSPRHDYS